MNVLVTGGSGFLGKALCLKLNSLGHTVNYLSRNESPELHKLGIKWFQGDISDLSIVLLATKDQNAVFHTAALAGYWGKREDYFKTNVKGTENIISGCIKNQVPFLINTSSPSVIFNGKDLENVNESMPYPKKYLCFYSETKSIAEKLVLENNKQGLKTISLRPHLIWGPGDNHLLPRVIGKAQKRKLKIVGDGLNKVDMIYIDNAVHGHILAWEGLINLMPCDGQNYFISDESPVALWPWINHLLSQLNLTEISEKISYKKAYRIGAFLEWLYNSFNIKGEPAMTRFVADSLSTNHYFDNSKAKKDFLYRTIVDAKEAKTRTIIDLKNRFKL